MDMTRFPFNPLDARAIFDRARLTPLQEVWYDHKTAPNGGLACNPCGCLMTALAIAMGPRGTLDKMTDCIEHDRSASTVVADALGWSLPFVEGIIAGWDNDTDYIANAVVRNDDDRLAGYNLAQVARLTLWPERWDGSHDDESREYAIGGMLREAAEALGLSTVESN